MARRAALASLLVAGTACSSADDDDGGGAAPTAAPTTAASAPTTAVTEPSTTAAAPSTTAGPAEPSGPACAGFPASGAGSFAAIAEEPAGTAISQIPQLSAMVAAIDAAGLLGALNGEGPLTIFAPVNAAFDAIPPADLEAMLTDRAGLNAILLYHGIADELSSSELVDAGEETTIEGRALSVAQRGRRVSINGGQANVICADIATANATIHLIDSLLMPPPTDTDLVTGTMLYSVDLRDGTATRVGPIGDALGVIGMAVAPGGGTSMVYGLTDVPELVTFDAADPSTMAASVPITGVARGSSLLAIDVRPANGDIVALSDASVLYTIDATSGAATAVGTAINPPVRDPGFGFDVDPVADRIRIDVATGQNLSVDPTNGEATVHGDLRYGRGDRNAGATPRVVAAAYSPRGRLFAVDVASGTLARQDPADDGTLATIGPLGVELTDGASFDIASSGEALLASPG
jgi:uncharacterized surface protein with fasciclin (FAS1) repeats